MTEDKYASRRFDIQQEDTIDVAVLEVEYKERGGIKTKAVAKYDKEQP